MSHPREAKKRIDYKVFGSTGEKVLKSNITDMDDKKLKELQVFDDIKNLQEVYPINELESSNDLIEYINSLQEYTTNYRHIHTDLKMSLGEDVYNNEYPQFNDILKGFRDSLKFAKSQLKIKKDEELKVSKDEEMEKLLLQNDQQRAPLKIREQVFRNKIIMKINSLKFNDPDQIEEDIKILNGFSSDYFDIQSEMKIIFADEYVAEFGDNFEKTFEKIDECVSSGREKLKALCAEIQSAISKEKELEAENAAKVFLDEQKFKAGNLLKEIKLRCDALIQRCDESLLNSVSDFQILDIKKRFWDSDSKMYDIFDKVTEYSNLAALCGDDKDDLISESLTLQDDALGARNAFCQKLYQIIEERGIDEEKLRRGHDVPVELPKFSGYESKLDIYSFRADFERLIQPTLLKRLWVDTLKKQYLAGPALILVQNTESLVEIWNRLFKAYGNVQLLLQNKLKALDKIESLSKIKNDEKLGNAIAKIANLMTELSNLATKFNLEQKLYIGGGFEKVMSLLGTDRERKFMKSNIELIEKRKAGLTKDSRLSDSEGPSVSECLSPTVDSLDLGDHKSELFAAKQKWNDLKTFLTRELNFCEQMTLIEKGKSGLGISNPGNNTRERQAHNITGTDLECVLCGKKDHVVSKTRYGRKCIDYVSCKKFANMTPSERGLELKKHLLCFQCLTPGMKWNVEHRCFDQYTCADPSHKVYPKGIHVLLCDVHKNKPENKKLLEEYMKNFILKRSNDFERYTIEISLVCFTGSRGLLGGKVISDVPDSAQFMLQTIKVENNKLNLFFDTGCGDIVIKKSAVDALILIGRAELQIPGPIPLKGVGDTVVWCEHGVYSIRLPLKSGSDATLSGVCLDQVTSVIPILNLDTMENDIRDGYKSKHGKNALKNLPRVTRQVGGDTDLLVGSKYLKYFPELVYKLESGLSLLRSMFSSDDGSTGVIAGPHPDVDRQLQKLNDRAGNPVYSAFFKSSVVIDWDLLQRVYDDAPIPKGEYINEVACECFCDHLTKQFNEPVREYDAFPIKRGPRAIKLFDEIENTGTEITYRCPDCRQCADCKKGPRIDEITIEEEVEQFVIDNCVEVDIQNGYSISKLPFIKDPDVRLKPNDRLARKIYSSQAQNLAKRPTDREAVIKAEKVWQDMGFVDYLEDLPPSDQEMILRADVKYIIPWRIAYNENSATTPVRVVLDATACPKGDYSLNDLLAKGSNNMNKMIEILIRWFSYRYAFHTDIAKCYNSVKLDKSHWKYHLYFWHPTLDPNHPMIKVLKTFIYGVKPSGNVAECAIRKTADLTKDIYPKAHRPIHEDIYVDDCASGTHTLEERHDVTEQILLALSKGGFHLKGFILSGDKPPPHLTKDGRYIGVFGLKWDPCEDSIGLNMPDKLNFSKKKRGRKTGDSGIIPEHLTRTACAGKVGEIFDPVGWLAPLTGPMKIDLNDLCQLGLDWGDVIPDSLRGVWTSNFEMMEEIGSVRFKRAVIPDDAIDTNIETIDVADASAKLICAAIYVRFRTRSGDYSCQLVFARTKVVPKDMTLPRAELLAASINASTGLVVQRAFGDRFLKCLKLTDSQVALHWINCQRTKLKLWVRNRVIEVNRLSNVDDWRFVESNDNIADLGTRKGAKLEDIGPESAWRKGLPWMQGPESDFPLKTISDIVLANDNQKEASKEYKVFCAIDQVYLSNHINVKKPYVPREVKSRYEHSKYLIDPNKFRFRKVVRVLALVLMYLSKLMKRMNRPFKYVRFDDTLKVPDILLNGDTYLVTTGTNRSKLVCTAGLVVHLSEDYIRSAIRYYFEKATAEVKHFLPEFKYKDSQEVDGILHHTGRILPTQEITGQLSLPDVAFDLTKSTFFVPIIDGLSPIAYSIANETHWYHPDVKHGGVESVLRQCGCIVYIIGGRYVVKNITKACVRCRILKKKLIEIIMGSRDDLNLCIAPAFYSTQVDLCGPFSSFPNSNKRVTIKVWVAVFCCTATSAVCCKIMEDYSTISFIDAFIRFSMRYGYPKNLLPDSGSQLVKGCKDMILSFSDIGQKLSITGVKFDVCPVGAHYVHGKVERKIQQIKKSLDINLEKRRLSIIKWETLMDQIANSINNLPIAIGNYSENLESLDLLTPNRLLIGRNNNRSPTAPLQLTNDVKRIMQTNEEIFSTWFKSWLTSYVPRLMDHPKWFVTNTCISEGDVVLFLKSDSPIDLQYQYGIILATIPGKDGIIRKVKVGYQNPGEDVGRTTIRGVRDLIVIHPIDEIGISAEFLNQAAGSCHH